MSATVLRKRRPAIFAGRRVGEAYCLSLLLAVCSLALPRAALAQCTNDISPAGRQHGHGVATNTVDVWVSPTSCAWSVDNTNTWVVITAVTSAVGVVTSPPFTGSSNGTVAYSIEPNPSIVGRTGNVVMAGQVFVLRQLGIPCNYSISPTNRIHGPGETNNTVTLAVNNQECAWTAGTTDSWLRVLAPTSGVGNATITYEIMRNALSSWRTGSVHVAGEVLTILQRPSNCQYFLEPTNYTHAAPFRAYTNQILVNTGVNCPWTATETNDWITLVFGQSGTGSGTIRYRLTANPSSFPRSGTITVVEEVFTITQAGAPCTYSFGPSNRLHSFHAETAQVALNAPFGCPWTISNTNSWIEVLTDTNGAGPATVIYSISANPNLTDRTGHLTLRGGTNVTTYRVRQERAICTYRVSPSSSTRGHGGVASATFSLTTSSNGCSWVISNTNEWMTATGTNSSGNGTITYSVSPNPFPTERVAVLYIGNTNLGAPAAFTLTQRALPCDYELSPTSTKRGFGGTTGVVSLTTGSTCPWTVGSTNDWISIVAITNGGASYTSPLEGTGSATIAYAIARNPAAIQRVGALTVTGVGATNISLTITQDPATCSYSITPSGRTHGHGAVTSSFTAVAIAGCAWGVVNTNPWVTITSPLGGSGTAQIIYSLQPNVSGNQRSGFITVLPQNGDPALHFSLAQLAVECSYTVEPTHRSQGAGVETNTFRVNTTAICPWDVINTNAWITILAGASGTGNGTVTFSVASNLDVAPRAGTLVVDGHGVTVSQAGYVCTFKVSPDDRTNGHGMATGVVSIITTPNCFWTVNNTNDWVTISSITSGGSSYTSPLSGMGNGSFTYAIAANPYPDPRVGTITVSNGAASAHFLLTQRGIPCDVRVSPATRPHGYGSATGGVDVITAENCSWTLVNSNGWIQITAVDPIENRFEYLIEENPNPVARTGYVMVTTGGSSTNFTIVQQAVTCDYQLSPASRNHGHGATNAFIDITTSGGCSWTVENTNSWISIMAASGLGSDRIVYAIDASTNLTDRTGHITIVCQDAVPPSTLQFTINQRAASCNYSISPSFRLHGFGGATGAVEVTTLVACSWLAINTNDWITITSSMPPGGISGSSTLFYLVTNNPVPMARTGVVMIADQALTIAQRSSDDGPPFALQVVERQPGGAVQLRLAGAPAGVWQIQASLDLLAWSPVGLVTNVTGVVDYLHSGTDETRRFYRAVQQR